MHFYDVLDGEKFGVEVFVIDSLFQENTVRATFRVVPDTRNGTSDGFTFANFEATGPNAERSHLILNAPAMGRDFNWREPVHEPRNPGYIPVRQEPQP